MAWQDPIVEDVRQARDAYAHQFNYDLDAIYRDLKAKEQRSGQRVVPCPVKPKPVSEQPTTSKPA